MARKQVPDAPPPGAPAYMVSFGDMMTNLLTFFILLCAFAADQKAGLVSDGIGSFRSAVSGSGQPATMKGSKNAVDLGATRVRYRPSKSVNPRLLDDSEGRVSDANRDSLRQATKESLKNDAMSRVPIEFLFEPDVVALSDAHKEALDIVAPVLYGKSIRIRIEAYAYEEGQSKIREVAYRRAESTRDYLVKKHGLDGNRIILSAYGSGGAGPANADKRIVQDKLGRRIVLIYLLPLE